MDQWGNSRKWSKWANSLFKRDKPLGSEPWFNPEAVTEQKREWIEQQQQKTQGGEDAAWPEHIYENFFIVGLPPDMELTQVAEQLCDLERKKQRGDSDNNDAEQPTTTKEHLQPPQPSFTPQVLLRMPPGAPAPISDDEVAAFCFPSGVAPEKLRRTPSLSALDELVMGRDSDQQQQCFVFMLKVGGNFPLYGCCWYVREMLHRPPYLARAQFRSCRAPFRQCMIAAPRCYCLLSHYPFFDLHFRVLKIVLDLERLERLLEYDTEKSKLRPPPPAAGAGANLLQQPTSPKAAAAAAGQGQQHAGGEGGSSSLAAGLGSRRSSSQPGSQGGSLANSRATSPAPVSGRHSRSSAAGGAAGGSTGGAAAAGAGAAAGGGAGGVEVPPSRRQTPDGDMAEHVVHNRQHYCAECAGIIEDMCPFTPGAHNSTSALRPSSWTQWQQQQRHRPVRGSSPLGGMHPAGDADSPEVPQQQQREGEEVQQQQQQQEAAGDGDTTHMPPSPFQQQHWAQVGRGTTPSVAAAAAGCIDGRCEVCGKRLRISTPDGGSLALADRSSSSAAGRVDGIVSEAAAAAAAAAAGGGGQQQGTLGGAIAGVLPARISAVLQSVSSAGPQQQQQQAPPSAQQQPDAVCEPGGQAFDAVAAAAADFDAAGSQAAAAAAAPGSQQQADQWMQWRGVVSAVRGAYGPQQQRLSHAGGSTGSLQDASTAPSTPGPETSMVQRMWETWAPKALESTSSSSADAGGNSSRLSGGLGLFKRASRASASGNLSDAAHAAAAPAQHPSSRAGSPALEQADGGPTATAGAGEQGQHHQQQQLEQQQQQWGPGQPDSSSHHQQQPDLQQQVGLSSMLAQPAQQQSHGGLIHSSHHGPSRLRPDAQRSSGVGHAAEPEGGGGQAAKWQADPNLRPLCSYKGSSSSNGNNNSSSGGGAGGGRASEGGFFPAPAGLEGLRDVSTTSNASFYSIEDAPAGGSSGGSSGIADLSGALPASAQQPQQQALPGADEPHQQQQQQQQHMGQSRSADVLQGQQVQQLHRQQQQSLGARGKSEILLRRHPSPPPGQPLPLVTLHGRRQQRWSDPASWPHRPRTPPPLPLLSSSLRGSHAGGAASSRTGGGGGSNSTPGGGGAVGGTDCIVSAFAAIAAAAEPFEGGLPHVAAHASTSSSSPSAGELASMSSSDSELAEAAAAVVAPAAAGPEGAAAAAGAGVAGWDSSGSSSQGGASARVNVTIGGGVIPSSSGDSSKAQLQQLAVQPPSRSGSGRRSALFGEVALRRSGDMSSELRMTISHLVQVDSSTLLAAYNASPVPQPGETYRLMLGDLYRLEFERCLPLQQYAPPGRSRLRQEVLTYAEVECAQHLQLWTVAALCRSLSVDNIITLVNAALLEKQLVVFCPHIGTLGSVVLSLVPLLRPFAWQSLAMPVTPVNMLGFLDAPVPFVLGVQYKTPDVASRCHGLLRVNVYKDAIKNASSLPCLPNTRPLASALAPFHAALCDAAPLAVERPVHVITPDEEEAARGFLGVMHDYLSRLCGDLRLHTIVNVGMSKRTGVFMKESLLESLPARDRAFMRAFMETQMFAAYADGVISDYCEA